MTRAHARLYSALLTLSLAIGFSLAAQTPLLQVPRRPPLPVSGDSNNAIDYFWYGMSKLANDPEHAAAAFYWASRIDPAWAEPVYNRYIALLLAQPHRLLDVYMTKTRENMHEPRLEAIDSIFYEAVLLNPWVNRRVDRTLFSTWFQADLDGFTIPQYIRNDYPALNGWLSYTEGKFKESAAQYATAISKNPQSPQLRFWRAHPFMALGQNDSAVAAVRDGLVAFRTAAAESLQFRYIGQPFMEYSLGLLYEAQHQPDSAKAAYERSLLDDLTFAPAHRRLGTMRLIAGDTAGALAEYDQAATLAPQDPMTLYEYGMLSLAAGQTGPGVELLQRVSKLEPFYVAPHFTLGRLYDQGGFAEEAIQEYRTFLRLAPRTMAAQMAGVRTRLAALSVPDAAR